MNNYIKQLLIIPWLIIQLLACKEHKPNDPKPEKWEVLELKIEDREMRERIGIIYTDSCFYSKTVFDTIYFKKHGEYFSETHRFFLSRKDKEALHLLFIDAIEHPVPTSTVSCYAGEYITLTLNKYGNPEISCSYSSVSNLWNSSTTLSKIKRLTFKNIKHRDDD